MHGERQVDEEIAGSNSLLPADGSDLGATTYWQGEKEAISSDRGMNRVCMDDMWDRL